MKKQSQSAKSYRSIRSRLYLLIVELILVFGICFVISSMVIADESRKNSEIREAETLMNGLAVSIGAEIDNYKDITRLIMLNSEVNKYLRAISPDAGLANDTYYGVMAVLHVCNNVDSVFVFRNDGQYMTTGRTEYDIELGLIQSKEWADVIDSKRGGAVVIMNANNAIYRRNGLPMFTIARAIYDIYTQKQTGMLFMNITTKMLDDIVLDHGGSNVAIFSDDGTFLSGDRRLEQYYNDLDFTGTIEHRSVNGKELKGLISSYDMEDLPFRMICYTKPGSKIVPTRIVYVLVLLLLSFVFMIVNASFFTARNITGPILSLSNAMEKTKESGWLEKIDVDMPNNEIGDLSDSYNSMIEYLNDLFTKLIEQEKSVRHAELSVLHEQIKPHFLYNSMETIASMAVDAGATNVYDALETLGSFYRNFLSKGNREIPLEREVSIVKDYLSLQKLRYGDIIDDKYDIAENTKSLMVPKLILQPLVENCIYHGIRPKGELCDITISSFVEDKKLHIIVYDNGVGMTQDKIDEVMSRSEELLTDAPEESGFGLKGTIGRIRYFCGNSDVVNITSEPGEYTRIEIVIPV